MNKNHYVVKHNKLIEAKAKMEFTLLEQKLLLSIISKIKKEDQDLNTYKFNIKQFFNLAERSEIGGKEHKKIHEIAEKLMDKIITIRNFEDTGYITTAFLSSVETIDNNEFMEVEISKKLKPFLINLGETFTQYQLENVLKLNSKHAIRVYEVLKQWQQRGDKEFELEEFKELLGLGGKYKRLDNFSRRVLEKAKEEINEMTDINIDYKKIKKGQKITHLKFIIKSSKELTREEKLAELYDDDEFENLKVKCGLKDAKINKVQFNKIYSTAVKKTDPIDEVNVYDYIKINVDYVKEKKPNQSFNGYLLKAIQEDYGRAITILKLLNKKE